MLQLAVGAWRESQRVVALSVVGALLLIAVATGDAEAMMLGPQGDGDGDGDGETDRSIRPVEGGVDDRCEGLFGVGKTTIDFGERVIGDTGELVIALASTNGSSLSRQTSLHSLVFDVVDRSACTVLDADFRAFLNTGPASLDAFAPVYVPARSLALTVSDGDRVLCEADLEMNFWSAAFFTGNIFALGLLWTSPHGQAAESKLDVFTDERLFDEGKSSASTSSPSIDCTQVPVAAPAAPVVPASTLALTCEPAVVSIGGTVTCTVSGGDPAATILWNALSSSAFAGQGVTLGSDGRGTFTFEVPAAVGDGPVLVELVDWDRTFTVTMSGTLVPVGVPAGEGTSTGSLLAVLVAFTGAIGLLVRRRKVAAACSCSSGRRSFSPT